MRENSKEELMVEVKVIMRENGKEQAMVAVDEEAECHNHPN